MRILIAGGGTGGHIYPGIAIAEQLTQKGFTIDFFCTERTIDKEILKGYSGLFKNITYQPIKPFSINPLKFCSFALSYAKSRKISKAYFDSHPDILATIGLGGFGSIVPIIEAYRRKIKTAIVNPDYIPGRANLFASKYFADKIFVQWEESEQFFKQEVIPIQIPLRRAIKDIHSQKETYKELACKQLNLDPRKKTIVISGGSSGAHSLNLLVSEAICSTFETLKKQYQIIHISGAKDFHLLQEKYKKCNSGSLISVIEYYNRMELLWGIAEFVITRAGAITVAELTHCRIPAIFLPYPYHKDRHQFYNAKTLADIGAGVIINDTGKIEPNVINNLADTIIQFTDQNFIEKMKNQFDSLPSRPDGTELIYKWLME